VGPFFSSSRLVLNVRAEHGVLFVKYCSILLQALTIEADEDLLFSLYGLIQLENIWEEETEE
jgi:vacuolar protein sorting-associated protein 13A/C